MIYLNQVKEKKGAYYIFKHITPVHNRYQKDECKLLVIPPFTEIS